MIRRLSVERLVGMSHFIKSPNKPPNNKAPKLAIKGNSTSQRATSPPGDSKDSAKDTATL